MKLSTRLVLLILGCLLPILTAQIYSQVNLYKHRHDQLGGRVLREAELANADMSSIIDGVHQLGTLAGRVPAAGDGCSERLTAVRQDLRQYRFLALFSPLSGALLCTSNDPPLELLSGPRPWLAELLNTTDVAVGPLVSDAARKDRFVPVAVHIAGLGTGVEPRLLVGALSAEWLAAHLETGEPGQAPGTTQAALIVADRGGTVVGRFPDAAEWIGRPVPDWFRPLLGRQNREIDNVMDSDGRTVIAAVVPNTLSRGGLTVIGAVVLPELTADIDQATYQNLVVIGGAAIVALIVAWVAGRRFIYRPSEALLRAARRWREGDLSARATLSDAGSEFAALGQSFNAMAAGLQAREMERRLQSGFLESQIAERARELSETNNRLQVEINAREKTDAALHRAQKLQAVGQLAGGIAHDFNNMLATVLGNLELMERRVSQAGTDWSALDSDRVAAADRTGHGGGYPRRPTDLPLTGFLAPSEACGTGDRRQRSVARVDHPGHEHVGTPCAGGARTGGRSMAGDGRSQPDGGGDPQSVPERSGCDAGRWTPDDPHDQCGGRKQDGRRRA